MEVKNYHHVDDCSSLYPTSVGIFAKLNSMHYKEISPTPMLCLHVKDLSCSVKKGGSGINLTHV